MKKYGWLFLVHGYLLHGSIESETETDIETEVLLIYGGGLGIS